MIALFLSPIYLIINFYILRWILRWMGACTRHFKKNWFRIVFVILYVFVSTTLLTSFLIKEPVSVHRFLKQISNLFLGTFIYILLTVALVDLLRIILMHIKSVNQKRLHARSTFVVTGGLCMVLVIVLSIYGTLHARHQSATQYDITIDKAYTGGEKLTVALVSDLHLGYSIGNWHMQQMVDRINAMNPDIVCIAGDIFDNEYEAVKNPQEITATLRGIQSKYGVYACWGNHDVNEKILAGFTFDDKTENTVNDQLMLDFLKQADIHLLSDEAALIDQKFYLIGRKDYSLVKKFDDTRKTPEQLTETLDKSYPIIAIDHQPKELQEMADAGVDLDLCGHTHDGQIFPGNLLIHLFWENACGYLKKDSMHNIVTSGVGVWGPNMRVGTKSEVVQIDITFHK